MKFNIVFMGTPDFAVPALAKISQSLLTIKQVYSQPPKKSNRGMKLEKSPIHTFAENNNLPVRTPSKLQDDYDFFKSLNIDLAIVVAYGQIISKEFLQLSKHGFLNIHASILPSWRGAAPIQRSIMSQDLFTGISIMKIVEKLDSGPVLLTEKINLNLNSTAGEVESQLATLGANKITEAIDLIKNNKANFVEQNNEQATYAKKITKEDEKINWNHDAKKIIAQIHGLNPRPGAYFEYKGEKIKIWKASYSEANGNAGTVISNSLQVACGASSLIIEEIQRPGKKIQKSKEFLFGFPIPKETQLN
jgi:methionyl-tRNA formyltransferase